jgi:hypothetical protein
LIENAKPPERYAGKCHATCLVSHGHCASLGTRTDLTALVRVAAACLKQFNVKELNVTKELNVIAEQ